MEAPSTFAHQVADDADGSQASSGKNRLPSAVRMVSPVPQPRAYEREGFHMYEKRLSGVLLQCAPIP